MIVVFAGDDLGQQSRARQALVDRLCRLVGRGDMGLTLWAGIGAADVLDDEQRRRLIIELLADVLADLETRGATFRAGAFGFAEHMRLAHARQAVRQTTPTVAVLFLGRWRGFSR